MIKAIYFLDMLIMTYIMSEYMNIKKFRNFKLIKNKIGLISYSFRVQKILLKFTYSFNSNKKIHKINNSNFLIFKGNPLDRMIENVISKKKIFLRIIECTKRYLCYK